MGNCIVKSESQMLQQESLHQDESIVEVNTYPIGNPINKNCASMISYHH